MTSVTKLDLKIREFKALMQVPEYDTALETLIRQADEKGIGLATWHESYSNCESDTETGRCMIRIKRGPFLTSRKEVVFDIMHELGHGLDPIKLPEDDRYNKKLRLGREQRAWAFADQAFSSFPELWDDVASYTTYKEQCLESYLKSSADDTEPAQ